ncbi:ExeM/NucH family extracellular endonuclease [Photobacterium toruni]|uniref:ExeM/NucH family extracellular endonuclease n=1 Tax=Photobacterium toruni TaxID=1935446 RepID=A0ABU6L1K6_9GAMM|nr:ExeM/NucH family extracellular endonuclease [Photobacterium toruni]
MKKNILAIIIGAALSSFSFQLCAADNQNQNELKTLSIQQIQGNGEYSPIDGIDVPNKKYVSTYRYKVKGIITAIQQHNLGKDLQQGFFMQAVTDNNPATSDGIFVQTTKIIGLKIGQEVSVIANISEDFKWTKLINVESIKILTNNNPLPPITALTFDDANKFDLERYEGMLVRINEDSDLNVTKNYGFDFNSYRNNMLLSHGTVNVHPNQTQAPTTSHAHQPNDLLVIESFTKAKKGEIPWYPTFAEDNGTGTTDNYIRIGDVVNGLEGVIGYSYGDYRFYVTNKAKTNTFIHTNDRTDAPELKQGGDLRIASFNVLNYFNSPFTNETQNPLKQNRGAITQAEFDLQSTKIANAIVRMNADIVGLMEIENNGFKSDSAVNDLVTKINDRIKDSTDHYAYVKPNNDEKFIGGDAISSQVIYKPSKVTLEQYRIIKMPEQHAPEVVYTDEKHKQRNENGSNHQRDTIAPTFKINGTDKTLTISVNHFKSKGSTCWEDVNTHNQLDTDKQGSCENLRVAAAEHLGEELAKISGSKIIIGDLNSYANEDPVIVLTNRNNVPKDHTIKAAAYTYIGGNQETGTPLYGAEGKVINKTYGYTNIIRQLHPDSYSFSYQNNIGTLDYILLSPDLTSKVVDAKDWNINAGESTLLEYANKNSSSHNYDDIYRASDHDPAIIDLKIKDNTKTQHSGGSTGIIGLISLFGILLSRKKINK